MSDPHLAATGNAAPASSAALPSSAPTDDTADLGRELGSRPSRKRNPIARIVLASAAGTSSPLHRDNYAVATNRGYGDAMGRGFELALTLVAMGGIGWLIDRAVGTYPLFIILFSVVGFAGITVKLFIGYDLEMRKHEDGAVWNRGKLSQADDATGNDADRTGPETMAS